MSEARNLEHSQRCAGRIERIFAYQALRVFRAPSTAVSIGRARKAEPGDRRVVIKGVLSKRGRLAQALQAINRRGASANFASAKPNFLRFHGGSAPYQNA